MRLYHRIRYSRLFWLYASLFKPELIATHRREVNLYSSFLHKPSLIFDIGAYDGHKTAAFAALGSKVVACEPDPYNFSILSERFRSHRNKIHLLNCAVSDKVGEATLQRNYEGSAFNTIKPEWVSVLERDNIVRWNEKIKYAESLRINVPTTTLNALIDRFGTPDFIKIDVEGAELEVIDGLNKKIKSLSFECLLPEFSHHLALILRKLTSLDENYRFNVIFNEELLFKSLVTDMELKEWVNTTALYTFDVLAISEEVWATT